MLDSDRAKGIDASIGLRLGEEGFLLHLADGRLTWRRGSTDGADLVLTGDPPAIAAAIYGGRALEDLEAAGVLRLGGDRALASRFATPFPLPSKAPHATPG